MWQSPFKGRLKRPLTFFDLETTGTDIARDRVVEIAMTQLRPDGTSKGFCYLVNPGFPIPKEATDIHGIGDSEVEEAGTFQDIAEEVLALLEGSDLAGYNIRRFDIQMLIEEMRRSGVPWIFNPEETAVIDGYDIFFKMEPRTLAGALQFYCKRDHEGAHGAHRDVQATMEVVAAQLARYDIGTTVEEVYERFRDKDAVDLAGKLRWIGPDVCINFGKYSGSRLKDMPRSYLLWMLDAHVIGRDAEHFITNAMQRLYLTRNVDKPAAPAASSEEEKEHGK